MEGITINSNLTRFMREKNEPNFNLKRYKASFTENYKYQDGTSLLYATPKQEVDVGDDFRDAKGRLYIVTEVVGTRPHRGVFKREEDRWTCYIVKSQLFEY